MQRIALVLALLSGCSFVFVSKPPPNHAQLPYFECTSSRVVPILDIVWTSLQTLNLLAAASLDDEEFEDDYGVDRKLAMGAYATLAIAGAAGIYYGWTSTSQCREAKRQQMMGGDGKPGGAWPPEATPSPEAPPDAPDPL
ncbi:MAG: hypothetical protein WKG01_30110 [Kofleriaceae bacterium]